MFGLMRKRKYLEHKMRMIEEIENLMDKNADLRSALSDSEHRNRRLREQLKKDEEEASQHQDMGVRIA